MSSTNQQNTIFLTPEEDERMRKTFKARLQKSHELEGQPRAPGDRQNQVATASFLSDIAEHGPKAKKGSPDAIVAFAVGSPYPPSTISLQDLQPMKLADLQMETHHRNRVLTIRRVAPVVKLQAFSWTVMQDESSDEMERLEILLHKSKHGQDVLESGSIFKIKEPYFTLSDQGEPTLRIDHPSDLVCIDIIHPDSPDSLAVEGGDSKGATSSTEPVVKTAKEYKEEGNAALKKRSFPLAHANYTQGLEILKTQNATKEEIETDLFRNRAHINLLLHRFDEAKTDGLSSLTNLSDQAHKELDSKAYFRAGSAAYYLGDFHDAKEFFEQQQKLTPDDKEIKARIRKCEARIKEQESGIYDFKKLKASQLVTPHPRIDAANFTLNIKVGESPGRGRGVFAARALESGSIVLCEKAFCVVWGSEDEALTAMTYDSRDERIRVFPAGLCKSVVQRLLNNPSQVDRVMDLYGDYEGLGREVVLRDSGAVVDVFQVHDIVARNAFGPGPVAGRRDEDEDVRSASAGLWVTAAYVNHSCVPNAKVEYIGDLMVLRATRAIAAGEEIAHCYNGSSDFEARSAALMNTWGFTCRCELCIAEKADSAEVKKKRSELEREAHGLVEKEEARGAKRLVVSRAKKLEKAIAGTYDEERYKGLPRLALARIQKWLNDATTR